MSSPPHESWSNSSGYTVSTDPGRVDMEKVFLYLHNEAYWCKGIPRDIVEKSIKYSIPFSIISPQDEFAGFARVVTDFATFAYLADVYVERNHRGRGLGKFLVESTMKCSALANVRTWLLLTIDAQGLYEQYGWTYFEDPSRVMRYRSKPYDVSFYG